MVLVRGYSYN